MSFKPFVLPPRSQVGVIASEIAGEGQRIILSDGEQVNYTPPPTKPVIPDWSEIKSIKHLFHKSGYVVYPAWLYHRDSTEQRLVKNAEEAAELGVAYREASELERGRYGVKNVWDWTDDSPWRPTPFAQHVKFDPASLSHGKVYVPPGADSSQVRNANMRDIALVVAQAVAAELAKNGPAKPATIDQKDWSEFVQFQAWKKSQAAIQSLDAGGDIDLDDIAARNSALFSAAETNRTDLAKNLLSEDEERKLWEDEATKKGLKVDRRWSLQRLKDEIAKAA